MTRPLVRLLAAALLGAVVVVGLSAPAQAAACPAGTGVTVVVNTSVRCDADGGGRASSNFSDAGHQLSFASRSAGFVCRVDGYPAADPCTDASPSDAYWALFWSDGTSGKWVYSSLGVGALKVPAGGGVAFVFQNSGTKTWPSVAAPTAPVASPQPTTGSGGSTPTKKAKPKVPGATKAKKPRVTRAPVVVPSASASSVAPTPRASASTTIPTVKPTVTASATPTADATVAAGESTSSADPAPTSADSSGGLSPAAGIAALVVLFVLGLAGGVVWRRRQGA